MTSQYHLAKGAHTNPQDGLCAMESSEFAQIGVRSPEERFWDRVNSSRGEHACWPWQGRRDEKGYGRVGFNGRPSRRAHRIAYELQRGPVWEGMCVLHRCDNPPCCNPAHLFIGTQVDNVADREEKGRGVQPPSRRKLTDDEVRAMRRMARELPVTQQQLADRYGVSRGNVSKILNRKAYADV